MTDTKSPDPIDSAKVEDTGELVAWLIERGDALPEATAVEEYARIAARNGARVTPLVPTTGSEPWQVGDDTSSVQISRDGSTHKWGCKCEGCVPTTGSAPLTEEERDGILDWVSACQSAYHIDNTPGHRFGGLGSNLEENHEGLIEFVESIVADRSALLAASMGGDRT